MRKVSHTYALRASVPSVTNARRSYIIRGMGTELWQRIRHARASAGITQQQLADDIAAKVGGSLSREAISQWESATAGKRTEPTRENLAALAARCGVPFAWIVDDDSSLDAQVEPVDADRQFHPAYKPAPRRAGAHFASRVSESGPNAEYVRFPLLEGFAGAGVGAYGDDYPEVVEFVEVARSWSQTNLRAPSESVRVITAHGDSMRGDVEDGDLLFIDSRVKAYDADGLYVFRRMGRVHVKRLQLMNDGLIRLKSSNPAYDSIDVNAAEIEVGGRVLATWSLKRF